jgi:hypothetical protein
MRRHLLLRTAPLNQTSPSAAKAEGQAHFATSILIPVGAEVEVACPAMAEVTPISAAAAVAAAREETVGQAVTLIISVPLAEAAEVAPSSMVLSVHRRGAVGRTSAVVQAAANRTMAIMPLAPAAAAVEED